MVVTMQLADQSRNSVLVDFWYYPTLDKGMWTNDWQARTPGYLTAGSGTWASLSIGGQWMCSPDDSSNKTTLTLFDVNNKSKFPVPQVGDTGDADCDTSGGGIFQTPGLRKWTCMLIT